MNKDKVRLVVKSTLSFKSQDLPDGVIGRLVGIAVPYGVPDDVMDVFVQGCFERTSKEKVAAGKVKLFAALDSHMHSYGTKNHVGVVRELYDDDNNCMMLADILDTEQGRQVYEYLKALDGADAHTGLSVGVQVVVADYEVMNGKKVRVFKECKLNEITITPMPAYEGTGIVAVKSEGIDDIKSVILSLLEQLSEDERQSFVTSLTPAQTPEEASPEVSPEVSQPEYVSHADRIRLLAKSGLLV